MCDSTALNVPPAAYEKMPLSIESDDPLLNVGKKELLLALRVAHENRWVAEWLFNDHASPFHRQSTLPPEAFDNSLAIHLHHDISTPGQCPQQSQPLSNVKHEAATTDAPNKFTISKDIDLLLVPVAKIDGVTVGYTFLKGVQEAAFNPARPLFAQSPADNPAVTFISGRFAFEDHRRDYLMVVNGMSPHMTGIVSMRWRDNRSRDRSFFAIPKADYGPDNLPSRVLSVQCNVDYEELVDPPEQQQQQQQQQSDGFLFDAHGLPTEPVSSPGEDSLDGMLDIDRPDAMETADATEPLFKFGGALESPWSNGLESIGTVITPDDPELLPELLQDFASGQIMDDVEKLFSDASDVLSSASAPSGSPDMYSSLSPSSGSFDSSSPSPDALVLPEPAMPSNMSLADSWLATGEPPDGVGLSRRPRRNDTSSGAFDMSLLTESLANIEESVKGNFFSPKVRKDILHPQTGELMSRCTGELRAKLERLDALSLKLFREVAAQSYYSAQLSISADARLITSHVPVPAHAMGIAGGPHPPAQKRVAPAPLAPRPVPAVAVSPVAPSTSEKTAPRDEKSKEAKLEAKRIKNRMSAAKSNQKRRAQLEAQRKELALLKQRVEELKSKKKLITEENESLRRQMQET